MATIVTTPLTDEAVAGLRAGDRVLITGTLLAARDAAHKRLRAHRQGRAAAGGRGRADHLLRGSVSGEARQAHRFGRATTSGRMDAYTPVLLDMGLKGMIGKGYRSQAVKDAMVRNRAVYFAAVGGAAALIAQRIARRGWWPTKSWVPRPSGNSRWWSSP